VTGPPIQPTIDAYGTFARASNLADHLELLCLMGQSLNRKGLADVISDRSWVVKMEELFDVPAPELREDFEDPSEEEAAATADEPGTVQANRVFDILDERVELLGDLYPFEVGDQLGLKDGVIPRESPYIALLAITLAHAHGVEIDENPTQVLETAVVLALAQRGLKAVDVAGVSRVGHSFAVTVERAAEAVELRARPSAVVTMTHANDEGVDALAHLPWGDLRIGAWAFLGQATCERSDGWPAKIREPSQELWKRMLSLGAAPFAFLAVPHHVEPSQFSKLAEDHGRLVLDRIRLARYRVDVTAEETAIVDAILDVGAEALA
jgi:hypothetical protein